MASKEDGWASWIIENTGIVNMPSEIVRKQTPEEMELVRKREELAAIRTVLADRELELADVRAQLRSFEGRYLREVGILYAELDEWVARIAELEASLSKSVDARNQATQARKQAEETRAAAQGEASKSQDFKPSVDLKNLFREVAKRIHPDFAKDDIDRERRTELMAEANQAYLDGDSEALRHILNGYNESSEAVLGEGIGAELVRIIRQIHQARQNIESIEKSIAKLNSTELAALRTDTVVAEQEGRNLLAEIETKVRARLSVLQKRYEILSQERKAHV
jgi:hypothetical protein